MNDLFSVSVRLILLKYLWSGESNTTEKSQITRAYYMHVHVLHRSFCWHNTGKIYFRQYFLRLHVFSVTKSSQKAPTDRKGEKIRKNVSLNSDWTTQSAGPSTPGTQSIAGDAKDKQAQQSQQQRDNQQLPGGLQQQ